MSEANKPIVRRYVLDVWGKGDYDAEREIFAPDVIDHNPGPNQKPGIEGHHDALTMIRGAFDVNIKLEDLIAEGDKVVDRWTAVMTQKADFMGMGAPGKTATISGLDVHRIVDGKIVELWHVEDNLGLMQQLQA